MWQTPGAQGAGVGFLFGLGLCLVLWRLAARRVRLIDRITPYLRERPATSRLLANAGGHTPFPTLERMIAPAIGDVGRVLARLTSPAENVERRLLRAGRTASVDQFRLEQLIWAVIGMAAGLALSLLIGITRQPPFPILIALVALATLAGAVACDQHLSSQVRQREKLIVAEFPALAELLALAVAAGESPVAALERVSRTATGELAGEIGTTLADVRAGSTLIQALDSLASRSGLASVVRFADGVATAVDRGTPLGEVLRAQAQDARDAAQRALVEEGGRREIYMMIPVVFIILPVSILFAVFPGFMVLQLG